VAPTLALPADAVFTSAETRSRGVPFVELFKEGRARVTVLLWIVNFANLLAMYFLSNWLPTVIHGAGYSTQTAVLAGTALWGGGVIGTLLLGRIIDFAGFTRVLATVFVIAIVATAAIGNPVVLASVGAMFVAIFLTGFSVIGGQPAINALAATYYPTSLRSTGIGWSLGVGRIGSVVGPVLGGALMHLQWSSASLFLAAAVPACVSLAAIVGIHRVGGHEGHRAALERA
jgi:AAHS family 4-hydroxybenzoate transporter-like MFS transporter